MQDATKTAAISRTRHLLFRICLALCLLFYVVIFSLGLGLLGPAWDAGGVTIHRVHHLGIALFTAIFVIGLLAQFRNPERKIIALGQVAAGVLALQITALIVGDPDNHGNNFGIYDATFLLFIVPVVILAALHPARHRLLWLGRQISPVLAGIALLEAIPLIVYGVNQALLQRNSWPPAADPHHNGHWMAMAMLAFAIPLVGLLGAFRAEGRQVAAWSAGLAAVGFELASVLYPDLASSVGRDWGALSIAGGMMYTGAAVWEAARQRAAAPELSGHQVV